MPTPEEIFKQLIVEPDGWRVLAAIMIPPIRMALKALYAVEMTKDQEMAVEAELYKAHVMRKSSMNMEFGYREAVKLQDKLIQEFKGDVKML